MVQPPSLVALHELKSSPAPADQLRLLRLIKNDIVGHSQRKELVVKHGLLDPLSNLILSAARTNGKRASHHLNGSAQSSAAPDAQWTIEDEIRLQATLIIGSLANGSSAPPPPNPF